MNGGSGCIDGAAGAVGPGSSPEPRAAPAGGGPNTIDEATAEAFRRDGVVHLADAFTEWVELLRAGVERNMRSPGPYTKEYEPEGSKGYFFGDYCNWARIPEYRDFVLHSAAAGMAARLMGSGTARFFHEHVLVKEPETESRTPWHHDLPYYCIGGTRTVSFWTALDPVPRPVCLELIVGSHRWGKSFLPKKFAGVDYEREGEALDTMPDIDARRGEFEIASFDMAPGDAHRLPPSSPCTARPGTSSKSARPGRLRPPVGRRRYPLQAPRRRGLAPVPGSAPGGCATGILWRGRNFRWCGR